MSSVNPDHTPVVGSIVRFSCQPYYAGLMEVLSVDLVTTEYQGERFHIVGRVVEGTETSRLFGQSSSRSIVGKRVELYCWHPAEDGGWDYVYPV